MKRINLTRMSGRRVNGVWIVTDERGRTASSKWLYRALRMVAR